MPPKKIANVLVSVFCKDNLEPLLKVLAAAKVQFIATGGTQEFIKKLGYPVKSVEGTTGYPSIFGGRVKTLHPAIFGGLLLRRNHPEDIQQANEHAILSIDMVIVDLYPVEKTIEEGKTQAEIIEKIDIGGVALIRAAAKNHQDVLTVASPSQYAEIVALLQSTNGTSTLEDRAQFAARAFNITSRYDSIIAQYFDGEENRYNLKSHFSDSQPLRYGENPHQKGTYYGDLTALFDRLNGATLSYNNLVDIDAAVRLISEFQGSIAFTIIKHTNACGVAKGSSVKEAYQKAFEADSISAFGGVLASNEPIDYDAAEEINKLFFDTLIAPDYTADAIHLLKSKKNRKILRQKKALKSSTEFKTILDGVVEQDIDAIMENEELLKTVTKRAPTKQEIKSLLFANKIVKHTKSNAIVLATEEKMMASGVGQTSRVDALNQAIKKAQLFKFDLAESVMASDAFFPFSDCVEIAHKEGIKAIIQPGGSIRDQDSIDFCNDHNIAMVVTGFRHFKH